MSDLNVSRTQRSLFNFITEGSGDQCRVSATVRPLHNHRVSHSETQASRIKHPLVLMKLSERTKVTSVLHFLWLRVPPLPPVISYLLKKWFNALLNEACKG